MPRVTGGSIDAHRRLTRQRIFEAFADLLERDGYDAITLAEVAATAGMSRTTMYNYFPDKDALVVAFAAEEAGRDVADLSEALAEVENPVDQLRLYVAERIRYAATHRLPPGRSLRLALSGAAYQRILEHVSVLEEILRDILERGAAEGYFPLDDVEATIPLVMACLGQAETDDVRDGDLDEIVEVTETFVLRALGVRLGPNGRPRRYARLAR